MDKRLNRTLVITVLWKR